MALEVKTHDFIFSPHQLAADEHRRNGRVAAHPQQRLLNFTAPLDLVQLVHRRIDVEVGEKGLDAVAHAARTLAEDHHRLLSRHSYYTALHFNLVAGFWMENEGL